MGCENSAAGVTVIGSGVDVVVVAIADLSASVRANLT